jgi:hypothetical protein
VWFGNSDSVHAGCIADVAFGGERDLIAGFGEVVGVARGRRPAVSGGSGAGRGQAGPLANPAKCRVLAIIAKPDLLAAGPTGDAGPSQPTRCIVPRTAAPSARQP